MANANFWDRQFSQVKSGEKPALTLDEMQARDKPELDLGDSNVEVKENVGGGDVAKAAASGVLSWAESVSEAAAKPEFTPQQQQQVIEQGYSPELVSALDANKNILELVAEKGRDWFGANKKAVRESMSVNAKRALEAEIINENLSFTDDAAKVSTWIMKGTETLSRMVPDLVLGGMGSKQIYNQTYEMMLKKGIDKGLTQEAARIAADKVAKGAMSASTAQMATVSATGGAGVQVRETVENTPWQELTKSETFKANFSAIDQDPKYKDATDKEKLNIARTMTAEQASMNVQQDPALLTANAAASFLGDATLGRIIQGRIGGGIAEKAIKGFAAEAPTEAGQGAMEQYAQNMTLIEVAGADIDPTKGVARSALEGAVLGGAIGGGVGGATGVVDKVTGREQVIDMPEAQAEADAMATTEDAQVTEPQVVKTVSERREELDEKLRGQRVTGGTGEVQEALSGERAPTVDELIAQARTQPALEAEATTAVEPEVKADEKPLTVPERREALNKKLELQRQEYESKRIETGAGEVQQRLSRPALPSVEELILKAPSETGPTPGELEFRSQQNKEYLEDVKNAKIPQAMKSKPGATRLLNKGYRKAMEDFSGIAEKISGKKELAPEVDTMTKAIEKLGGLDRGISESEGMDPESFKRNNLFPAKGGMSFDHAAELLNEQGYKNREGGKLDANDVVDMVYGEVNSNERHLSSFADADMLTPDADIVRQWSESIGGPDKLNTAIKKALNGEKLGKRQADIVEEVLDTVNAIRNEDAESAKQELQSRRDQREQKRVDDFNNAYQELTEVDDTFLYDYEQYAESFGEMPEHFTEQQALLSELVSNAGDRDYQATNELIDSYENGDISLPKLLDQLSEIASKELTYEQIKPRIQTTSEPTTQRTEGSDAPRTEQIEAAPAVEPAATTEPEQRIEPEPTAPDGLEQASEPSQEPEQAQQLEPDVKEVTPSVDQGLVDNKAIVNSIENDLIKSIDGEFNKEEFTSKVNELLDSKSEVTEAIESTYSNKELVNLLGANGQLNANKSKAELADLYYEKIVNDTLGGKGLSLKELGEDKFKERAKILAENYTPKDGADSEPKSQFSQESRTTGAPKGVDVKEAELLANQFLKKYKGAAGVKVKVFATQAEAMAYSGDILPEGVKVNAYRIPQTGEVVLIAENLDGPKDVWQKLRHEILAHHGLFNLVGESEWRKIMNLISQSRNSRELKELWDQIDTNYPELREDLKAEEVIAHIAEYEPGKIGEFADRIISAVVRALRNIGLINPGMMQVEVRDLIRVVGQRIKSLDSVNGTIRNDIMYSKEVAEPSGFSIPDETRKDRFIRGIADKYQRLKVVQESVKEQGGKLGEAEDVYLAEELFHGKIGEDMRSMEADYIKPLQDTMIERNVDAQELDLYLIARHAPERNAHIAEINPKMQDGGSGMTNAEASEIMNRFESEGKTADMKAAAAYVDKMLVNTRNRLVESGLETVDAVESWDTAYKFYVPLKGFANNEIDTEGNSVKPTGRGFNIRGKETMKAMGRRTMAESPVAYAISDATQSMMRARKNEVGQTLLRLVDANHDPDLWQVFSDENPDVTRRIVKQRDPVTGKMKDQVVDAPAPMFALKDQYLGVKMNGEQYYIKLNDVRLMEAMSNLGVEQANLLTKTLGRVTRMLSALITSYNPEFALSNLARDIQTAMYNVLAESEVKGGKAEGAKGLASQIAKDVMSGRSFKALKKGLRDNNFEGEWGEYFKEYLDSGAKTGYFVQKEIEEIKNDIQKSIAKTGPGAVNALLRSKDKVIKFVDDYNDVVENASRLSVYVNARKQGFTEKQAASLAKNLTVNFNRRGEMTNNINALYMFFNASVQGTMNMLRAVATPKDKSKSMFNPSFYNTTQKIAMMLPIATIMAASLNRSVGGDDDDGKAFYDKVPDFVKETNFVLMIPGSEGDYIKIPMPYGYNFFASVGLAVDKSINGEQTAIESGFDLVSAFAGAFNPLGITDSEEGSVQVLKMASPSVMKPFVEMATNENFYGGPLYKQQNPFGLKLPDAYNSQRRTWEIAKGVSEWINDATGGNEFKSGYVDIAPESFQHLISFVGGGLGTLVGRTQDLAVKGVKGEEIEDKDVPFWRKYFGNISDSVDIAEMYDRFDSVKEAERQLEGLPKKEALKYRVDNIELVKLIPLQKAINKQLTKLNKRRREVESSKLSDERKKVIVDKIEDQKRVLASKFNKRYNDKIGK